MAKPNDQGNNKGTDKGNNTGAMPQDIEASSRNNKSPSTDLDVSGHANAQGASGPRGRPNRDLWPPDWAPPTTEDWELWEARNGAILGFDFASLPQPPFLASLWGWDPTYYRTRLHFHLCMATLTAGRALTPEEKRVLLFHHAQAALPHAYRGPVAVAVTAAAARATWRPHAPWPRVRLPRLALCAALGFATFRDVFPRLVSWRTDRNLNGVLMAEPALEEWRRDGFRRGYLIEEEETSGPN